MFFQINITPKEKERKEPKQQVQSPVASNYSLMLAPFQPQVKIKLETRINITTQCSVTLENTNNRVLNVSVVKTPPMQERWITLSCTEWTIPAGESAELEIIWNPKECGIWRDIIQLMDNRRIKYDVPLILSCLGEPNEITKQKGKKILHSKTNSQINNKILEKKIKDTISKTHVSENFDSKRPRVLFEEPTNKENVSNNIDHNWFLNQAKLKRIKKEDPPPPPTLQVKTECLLYESTFLTEEFLLDETKQNLRRGTYVKSKLRNDLSDELDSVMKDNFEDSLEAIPKSDFSMLLDDIKLTPGPKTPGNFNFAPYTCSTTHKYKKETLPQGSSPENIKNKTFVCPEVSVSNLECNGDETFELPNSKFSTTRQSLFSKSVRQCDDSSVKDILQADLWAKPTSPVAKQLFSNSINEESAYNNENKVIEISPPKRFTRDVKFFPRRKSPMKSGRIVKEKPVLEPATLKKRVQETKSIKSPNGVMTMPGVKITKLSRILNHKSFDSRQNDPHSHLNIFCNPDPFAATMTHDPFLTSSVYFDDQWVVVQELEFKKWLNELLTPPEHLSADVDTPSVDIGKVWQSCRLKVNVVLAETKESVSARYHTNTRLNTLRKAACVLFRNSEVTDALSRTTVGVEKGILLIREDRDLNKDIGLQKTVLELFLSYNPLWLRIGLETVYGETIPLQSNDDLIGLTRFLLGRFFSDPFIAKMHSHQGHPNFKLPTYKPLMNKFMLKKFLFLVYFLDYAKRKKLIGHDPCLFHKRANTKDSRAVLLTFSREILKGIGDITKVLRNYGYVVSHKQTYLDEFNYALVSIATDLRDGVRLCKIMELITGNKNLTCKCRVPAISRLQKIHNVDVALRALIDAGYTIKGDIDAKSIADGHREKTLSLLWQIIHKFQAPRFEKAACTVQRWWRSKLWFIRAKNLVRLVKYEAASTIQRSWHVYQARKELRRLREERILQNQRREAAALKIQSFWRLWKEHQRQQHRHQELSSAATKIQRWWRRNQSTKPYVLSLRNKLKSVKILQIWWKSVLLVKRERRSYLKMILSTRTIENWWIMQKKAKRIRECYLIVRSSAIVIQRAYRRFRDTKDYIKRYKSQKSACIRIQSWWKSIQASRKFETLKRSCVVIQRWRRNLLLTRSKRHSFLALKRSVAIIEKNRRMQICRRSYKRKRLAAVTVQNWYRHAKVCRAVRKNYVEMKAAVKCIECWWCNLQVGKAQRLKYLELRKAARMIQQRWRERKAMKEARRSFLETKNVVVKMQSWCRMVQERRRYQRLLARHKASMVLQTRWRALKCGRDARALYYKERSAIITIQNVWRAILEGRKQRKVYHRQKDACVVIQKQWREFALRKRHKAAKVLQTRWRAMKLSKSVRAEYLVQRSMTVVIQVKWRAILLGRVHRKSYLEMKSAALTIQKYRRSVVAVRRYKLQKLSIRKIQAWWRNHLLTKRVREEYIRLKTVAIQVQRRWKTKRQVANYRMQRLAIIKIQLFWRSTLATRRIRKEYLEKRVAAIVLQRRFRAKIVGAEARANYLKRYSAICKIQRWWRRVLASKNLAILKEKRRRAVGVLEEWWLRVLEEKRIRLAEQAELERLSALATKIQTVWRGYRVRRSASKRMHELCQRSKKATEAAVHSNTLAARLQESINVFLYANNIGQLAVCLSSLDVITQMSPNACMNVCRLNLVPKLYDILTRSNRSLPWLDVCLKVTSILVTLAKFKGTTEYVLRDEFIEVLARLLHVALDNKMDLFLHVATLLWILTENSDYAEAVTNCSRSKWLLTTLRATVNKKSLRTTAGRAVKGKVDGTLGLPSPKPNWGLRHKRPRVFTSPSQAINSILTRLNLPVY